MARRRAGYLVVLNGNIANVVGAPPQHSDTAVAAGTIACAGRNRVVKNICVASLRSDSTPDGSCEFVVLNPHRIRCNYCLVLGIDVHAIVTVSRRALELVVVDVKT